MDETNPQEVSPEAQLEAAFAKRYGEDTPPKEEVDDEPEVDDAEPDEGESTESESETDEADSDEETAKTEDDAEEVEFEGKAYKVPKEIKDALLRQSDYTRKTQEVAEQRKVVQQQVQEIELQQAFQKEHFPKMMEMRVLETQLQQFAQVDWRALIAENPAQAMELQLQRDNLRERAGSIKAEIQQLAAEHGAKAAELRQQAQARCIETVRKDIKGFDADMLRSIDETARGFGFTGEELAQVTDPRVIKVLHAAMQYQKLQASKPLAAKKVQDAKPVQVATSRSAQPSMQTKQLADARARLKSTGRPGDAEAFLAAKFARSMR